MVIMDREETITEQVRAIPKSAIRQSVRSRPATTPDADIIAEYLERARAAGATDYQTRRIIQYALACHHVRGLCSIAYGR